MNDKKKTETAIDATIETPKKKLTLSDEDLASLKDGDLASVTGGRAAWPGTLSVQH